MIDLGTCGFRCFCAPSDSWITTEVASLMSLPAMTSRNAYEHQWMGQVVRVVLSYIDYANRTVWHRG